MLRSGKKAACSEPSSCSKYWTHAEITDYNRNRASLNGTVNATTSTNSILLVLATSMSLSSEHSDLPVIPVEVISA